MKTTRLLILLVCGLLAIGVLAKGPPPQGGDNPPPPHADGQRPPRNDGQRPPKGGQGGAQGYTLEQAMSDRAQLTTIAFSGLAFITGDFGAASPSTDLRR